jgi:hypothetical protein
MEISDDNDETIFFYKDMKYSLHNFNYQLELLLEENNRLHSKLNLSNILLNIDDNTFINYIHNKLSVNKENIKIIDDYLLKNCNHEIIEDYIEGGVEDDMIKIKYCSKCEMSI